MKKLTIVVILLLTIILSSCGRSKTIEFVINEGVDTIELGAVWIDEGASLAVDDESFTASSSGTVDEDTLGFYLITYSYTFDETEYIAVRYVIVADQTKPVLTLNSGIDSITVDGTWIDAGAIVTDNSGEVLTVVVSGTVEEDTAGSYIITYTATDSSGNVGTIIRTVHVLE